MIALEKKKPSNSEQGFALIIALLTLLLISAALMGMFIMSNTETNVSANFRDEQTAYFASKGGIEEARDRMRATATNTLSPKTTLANALPGQPNGILYVTNPAAGETDTPWVTTGTNYPDDELCKELTPCGTNLPAGTWTSQSASTSYAAAPILPWKWVRVMEKINKPSATSKLMPVNGSTGSDITAGYRVCWTGTNEIATVAGSCKAANPSYTPVYELTALAVTPSGSRRMRQYEASQTPFPAIPGAFVFDGSNPSFNPPNSSAFNVMGNDVAQGPTAGVGCDAGVNQPALGVYDPFDATPAGPIQTAMAGPPNRSGQYTSSTPYVATPAVSDVNSSLSSGYINLTTVDGLTKFANTIVAAAGANVYPSGAVPTNMGTSTAPVINVVNGDFTFTGSGAGILLVTGQLTLNGNFAYNGLILAIGEGAITKSGGGNGTVNGAMFAANMYHDNPGTSGPGAYPAYTNPIALGSSLPPGIPYFGWSGGGSAIIQYDSCWIGNATQGLPFTLIAQRELIY